MEVLPEVLTEDGVKNRIGRAVDVGYDHGEDMHRPVLVEVRGPHAVVDEQHLLRGVADEVHHHAHDQHLHHPLAGLHRLGRPGNTDRNEDVSGGDSGGGS